MSFINNYSSYITYNYSKEFIENDEPFILTLGISKSGFNGIVSKVDLNGNIVWEKYYVVDIGGVNDIPLTFKKIIQIIPNQKDSKSLGTQYIISAVGSEDSEKHFILSINSVNGNVNWFKEIKNKENHEFDFFIEPRREFGSPENYAFYIALSNKNNVDGKSYPFIGRCDSNGNLVSGKNITFQKNNFKINDIHAHEKGCGLACEYTEKSTIGLIIDLNVSFEFDNAFIINTPCIIQNLKITAERNYYISGYLIKEGKVFVCKVPPASGVITSYDINLYIFPETLNQDSKLQLSNNGIYVLHNTETHGILYSLDSNLDLQWSKELKFNEFENGISTITYNTNTNNITTLASNNLITNALVLTDNQFTSCKTVELIKTLSVNENSTLKIDISSKNAIKEFIDKEITITVIDSTIKTEYCPSDDNVIDITEVTALQSPNFYLQSAGSTGFDSSKGIHTRWMFRGALGGKHLPKGNNASNNGINFNKQDDFVKIYRTKYIKQEFHLDLFSPATIVDDINRLWIYRFGDREFFVYFRDTDKYDELISQIDPLVSPQQFISHYENRLIEIENKNELFFAVVFGGINGVVSSSRLQLESLSVAENTLISPKVLSFRNTYDLSENNNIRVICENGRSIRYKPTDCLPYKFVFEFYEDFIAETNNQSAWNFIGNYALSLQDTDVFNALEPLPNSVKGKWKRYNDDAYVNIDNYKNKWNEPVEATDRNIKQVVQSYITLSDVVDNPTAIESVPLEDQEGETLDISHLDLLNIASYDFHVARMLGLGLLDLNPTIFNDSYVYVAEYTSFGDLEDGLGAREVQHLSMSLPTAIDDQRQPLPIDLKEIVPGVFIGNEGEQSSITGEDGYTQDGRLRYITLFTEDIPENQLYPPFFISSEKYNAHTFTFPVYAGLEYRKVPTGTTDSNEWEKPELSNDFRYLNADINGNEIPNYFETRFIGIPEIEQPFYVHKHRISGEHFYSSYGINWFSRATQSRIGLSIKTAFNFNPLLPPSNINSVLIRTERPLLLSSEDEQDRLNAIQEGDDETLVRITFDYHSYHELVNHKISLDSPITNNQILDVTNANDSSILFPDDQEIFADNIAIYFRNQTPNNISGKIIGVELDDTQDILSVITTDNYFLASQDPNIDEPSATPIVISGTESNYVGGTLIIGQQQYIIYELTTGTDGFAVFKVYNKEISDGIITNTIPSVNAENLQIPEITDDGFFMAVENMQNSDSWGAPNPLAFQVTIDENWPIHREIIEIPDDDGNLERQVEKTRGIWSDIIQGANIEEVPNNEGVYKITFNGIQLDHHQQDTQSFNQQNSVEWYKGVIRVFTQNSLTGGLPNKTRKNLTVFRIENVGAPTDLIVYAFDASFSNDVDYDSIQIGNGISVNFYPGYKVYLYKDDTFGLNETNILPDLEGEDDVKYSIFGLQSNKNYADPIDDKKSKISVPSLMFAQKMIEALPPEQPEGALYATRPDFFGRSTYTITTKYQHRPHGVLFYRSNEQALLNALYSKSTILLIREQLKILGGNDEDYFNNRWENFLNFDELILDGDFKIYPPAEVSEDGYKFPNPDKLAFFEWANVIITRINENSAFPPDEQIPLFIVDINDANYANIPVGDASIINFVKGAIFNAFVPLTEIPIIYQHIKPSSYRPINKKQVVRDRNGNVLHPNHEDFEMAPMMKIISTVKPHETQFVDFNLDGTSNNVYFYGVRELSSQMKMGEFSPFLGPIKLVNTNPAETPEIKRIMPVFENPILETLPSIQLEINAYPEVQNIKKINIYRAFNKLDALSIRTMRLVKTVDIEDVGIASDAIWSINDDFQDLVEIPYGDGLFYRITVARKTEYAKADYNTSDDSTEIVTEYAPSQASKIIATIMVEVNSPITPSVSYLSKPINLQGELHQFTLRWNKTCYKGKYHVYKMNNQGNWVKIHELTTNDDIVYLELESTDIQTNILQTLNEDGNTIYHHFKIVAENTSGMLSVAENILTTHNEDNWTDIDELGV